VLAAREEDVTLPAQAVAEREAHLAVLRLRHGRGRDIVGGRVRVGQLRARGGREYGQREKSDHFWEDHRRRLFGEETVFHNEKGEFLSPAEQARVTELDVRWMIEQARARSIPFVAITYPFPAALFTAPNEGIRKATAAYGAAVVEATDAGARVADEYRARGEKPPRLYDDTLHPTQFFYDAIGDLVLEKLDERGYL